MRVGPAIAVGLGAAVLTFIVLSIVVTVAEYAYDASQDRALIPDEVPTGNLILLASLLIGAIAGWLAGRRRL